MKISLEAVKAGSGGLDAHRTSMLNRVPEINDWARFPPNHLKMGDLAYLSAKTGHEFAILRGKREDILFHGDARRCSFDDILVDMLMSGKLQIYGHSHPGEDTPVPSPEDRKTLSLIRQLSSKLISALTGNEITYTSNPFEIL